MAVMQESILVLGKYTLEYLVVMGNHVCRLPSNGSKNTNENGQKKKKKKGYGTTVVKYQQLENLL